MGGSLTVHAPYLCAFYSNKVWQSYRGICSALVCLEFLWCPHFSNVISYQQYRNSGFEVSM